MNATNGPDPDSTREARELLDLTLQGAKANRRPDLIRRLTSVKGALSTSTTATQRASAGRDAANEALRALDSLEFDLRSRRATLSDSARTARLSAELASVRAHSDRFSSVSREWQHILGDGFASVNSDVDFDLRARVRAVFTEVEQDINAGDPDKNSDEHDAQLRARLASEAEQTYQRLHSGACAVAAELATQLNLPSQHRVPAPDVTPPRQLVADLSPPRPPGKGAPMAARLLPVLMPGYAGIMIALVSSRFLGLNLPNWVIAVIAVVGAVGLGGAAASGERKRQLDRRRGEAFTALRGTVEEFQVALAKQVRDASRVIQQDLRRATAAAVTSIGPALARELDTIRDAAETARRAPAELSDISDDLESITKLRDRARSLLQAISTDHTRQPDAPTAPPAGTDRAQAEAVQAHRPSQA